MCTFAVPFGNERDFYEKSSLKILEEQVQASTENRIIESVYFFE